MPSYFKLLIPRNTCARDYMTAAASLPRALHTLRAAPHHLPRRCLHNSRKLKDNGANNGQPQLSMTKADRSKKRKQEPRVNASKALPKFTEDEYKKLEKKYTPEQIEAIKLGEDAIDSQDIVDQGVINRGHMTLTYVDDFASIRPVIDKQPRAPESHGDPKIRWKDEEQLKEEIEENLVEWMAAKEDQALNGAEQSKLLESIQTTVGNQTATLDPPDYRAPTLPKMSDPLVRAQARASKASAEDDEMAPYYQRLVKVTGMHLKDMKMLRIKTMIVKRVVNQTRMGKVASLYHLTIAGNGKGLLGIGEGKGREAPDARRQSIMNAIRNLTPIPRYEDRTIYGDVKGKMGATELELFNRPPGFGIRCQDKIYEMCKCAGISDLSARVTRARNPMNIIKATFQALTNQRDPEEVARGRGRKLVDLRKVYYAGNV